MHSNQVEVHITIHANPKNHTFYINGEERLGSLTLGESRVYFFAPSGKHIRIGYASSNSRAICGLIPEYFKLLGIRIYSITRVGSCYRVKF